MIIVCENNEKARTERQTIARRSRKSYNECIASRVISLRADVIDRRRAGGWWKNERLSGVSQLDANNSGGRLILNLSRRNGDERDLPPPERRIGFLFSERREREKKALRSSTNHGTFRPNKHAALSCRPLTRPTSRKQADSIEFRVERVATINDRPSGWWLVERCRNNRAGTAARKHAFDTLDRKQSELRPSERERERTKREVYRTHAHIIRLAK